MVALLERIKRFSGGLDRQYPLSSPLPGRADSENFNEIPGGPGCTRKLRSSRYLFAFWVLPQFFFEQADAFYASLREDRAAVLRFSWSNLCARRRELPAQSDLDAIAVELMPVLERRCAWITFPPPLEVGEAYYVAVISEDRAGDGWRYFVFERTASNSGSPEGILTERLSDGSTSSTRLTGDLDIEAFQEVVRRQLLWERCRALGPEAPAEAPAVNPQVEHDLTQEDDLDQEALEPVAVHARIRWEP